MRYYCKGCGEQIPTGLVHRRGECADAWERSCLLAVESAARRLMSDDWFALRAPLAARLRKLDECRVAVSLTFQGRDAERN